MGLQQARASAPPFDAVLCGGRDDDHPPGFRRLPLADPVSRFVPPPAHILAPLPPEPPPFTSTQALRLVRHIVNKGCGQFQRAMQKHASLVRDHVHFKGDPDPYKGDVLNQRVRDTAKEAAESLFNAVAMAPPVNQLGVRPGSVGAGGGGSGEMGVGAARWM